MKFEEFKKECSKLAIDNIRKKNLQILKSVIPNDIFQLLKEKNINQAIGIKNSMDGEHYIEINFKTGKISWECDVSNVYEDIDLSDENFCEEKSIYQYVLNAIKEVIN